jgi:hypothetical protein
MFLQLFFTNLITILILTGIGHAIFSAANKASKKQ